MITLMAALAFLIQDPDPFQEVNKLRGEIQTLRMLNTLELTKEQMEKIVELADEVAEARKEISDESGDDIKELKEALTAVRDALRSV